MMSAGLEIKFGILYALLKYLGSSGNVLTVTIIYTVSFLFLSFTFGYEYFGRSVSLAGQQQVNGQVLNNGSSLVVGQQESIYISVFSLLY